MLKSSMSTCTVVQKFVSEKFPKMIVVFPEAFVFVCDVKVQMTNSDTELFTHVTKLVRHCGLAVVGALIDAPPRKQLREVRNCGSNPRECTDIFLSSNV
jgi:hypothetical protein